MSDFEMNGQISTIVCASCHCSIYSKFLLRLSKISNVSGDKNSLHFHLACLRCSRCGFQLDGSDRSCWENQRHGVLCQSCYNKMTRCAKCKVRMRRGLLVQRIQDYVFHLDCFVCSLCNRRLQFGELIGFVDGEIFCAEHVRTFPLAPSPSSVFTKSPPKPTESGHLASADHSLRDVLFRAEDHLARSNEKSFQTKANSLVYSSSRSEAAHDESIAYEDNGKILMSTVKTLIQYSHGLQSQVHHHQQSGPTSRSVPRISTRQHRPKRIRTSFTPQQIALLQASFKTVSNPDGQELERIARATCLTKRVTQVWFQNARARKKKNVQYQQPSPFSQSIICGGDDVQGDTTREFVSNSSLNGAHDRGVEDESEVWISPPLSPHLNSTLEDSALGTFCTTDSC